MSTVAELPKWDVSCYFPGIGSEEFDQELKAIHADVLALRDTYDTIGVGAGSSIDFSSGLVGNVEKVISADNALSDRMKLARAYIHSFVTTDASDDVAQAKQSQMQGSMIIAGKLTTRFYAWVGRLPLDSLLAESSVARDHKFALRKAKMLSEKMMSPEEEALATDLSESGGSAWARLYGNFSSQISVPFDGKTLPISAVRNLAYDADAAVRKAAFEAELAAWKENEVVIAAAMNAIKYETELVSRKRGWASVLDGALFSTNIDAATLDAMMSASHAAFPAFRRYLGAKSRLLGNSGALPWHDLFAPVGDGGAWSYSRAQSFVEEGFRAYSDKMGDLAARAYAENWVDVPPHAGKRDGAFCMGSRYDESRILMNFKESFGSVATLAHELGHAYHNLCLKDRTAMQSGTPMTLAETASIFCETVIKRRAIAATSGQERLAILEASIMGACQTVVDITSRFIFEKTVFEKRPARELSAAEFCSVMESAQKETYGDGLSSYHPYMWAVKPHYYSGRHFYNYPYMFGLLFSLGLYAVYESSPDGFHDRYDDLLSSTGMFDAAELASRFGIDIRSESFWAGSLSVIEKDIDLFVAEAGR